VTTGWRERWAASRWLIAVELGLVAAVFVADAHHLVVFSKTPYLLALAWASLALRGVRWRDLGVAAGPSWRRWLLVGLGAGIAMEALELFITQPALTALTGQGPDLSDFAILKGNVALFALAVGLSWTLAAVGEELVWRGWILNRLRELFGASRWSWGAALAVMSAAFGLAHADQGITGVIENTLNGALLGGLYLAAGRNLIAPVVAHGVTDTIDVSLIFAGVYPGL
jgi:membrane protease YdiL (CAAX protease family)